MPRVEVRCAVSVNEIVDAFREVEEGYLVGLDDHPLRLHAEFPQQRDLCRQHLRDATAPGGRVHHPDPSPLQLGDDRLRLELELLHRRCQVGNRPVVLQRDARGRLDAECHSASVPWRLRMRGERPNLHAERCGPTLIFGRRQLPRMPPFSPGARPETANRCPRPRGRPCA